MKTKTFSTQVAKRIGRNIQISIKIIIAKMEARSRSKLNSNALLFQHLQN